MIIKEGKIILARAVMHLFFIALLMSLVSVFAGCSSDTTQGNTGPGGNEGAYEMKRKRMLETQIKARGIRDARVLEAMLKVPRHLFVPEAQIAYAYDDGPLPIREGQTISQPYIVALMTELAELGPESRVLEIGTGSGYQAAVLAEICKEVYSIEILERLGKEAEARLRQLGYTSVSVKIGDGYQGWKEHAPFDAIIVTAAPEHIPQPLVDQLKTGGRLVIPLGEIFQELVLVRKTEKGITKENITGVRFVPMTGEAEKR